MIRVNKRTREVIDAIRDRLPSAWRIELEKPPRHPSSDFHLRLVAPDRRSTLVHVEVKSRIEPRDVRSLSGDRRDTASPARLVASRFLSPSVREKLESEGLSYVDSTGNLLLRIDDPGVFVRTTGRTVDPAPRSRATINLGAIRACRIVRTLLDHDERRVREIARLAQVDPGYVSRVLSYLDAEALVTRDLRGRLVAIDREALVRRWAIAAPLDRRGVVVNALEPRGISVLLGRLRASDLQLRYAVTGSIAATRFVSIAPARLAIVYFDDVEKAIATLSLRRADAGSNVFLIEPADEMLFDGTQEVEGLFHVAPSQLIHDLLTSPGRGPEEAEAVIAWMREHRPGRAWHA